MAKIKYDVSDVEVSDRNYVQPQPGMYGAKIVEANHRNSDGKNDIEVVVEVTDKGEYQSARLWSYVSFSEAARWKLRELTDAVGLPPSGTIDTDKLVGKKLKIKVNAGSYEGEYRARLQRFLSASTATDGDDGEGDEEDYSTWDLSDLKAEVEDRGIGGNIAGRKTKEKLVEALEADDAGAGADDDEEEEEPEEEEEEAEDDDTPDYSSMSLADLKAAAEEAGLTVKGPKSKFVAALEEWAASDGDEEEEADGEEDDYDEWELDELLAEVKDRELTVAGRKTAEKLIKALRDDDSLPFDN